ncbi:MAG TPA: DNA mismatch repair endonuclease MutL [Chitinispirillaceae bacterium]|nr:DNA mismatch repair endonuclease MutL [Chitinispirillaceae bacterium]
MQKNTIEILPKSVIEKIAAGEVVERPSSVLKELVENSIDATATKIDITVEDSGFSLLKVADNGNGMNRDDLSKCCLQHATSKIRSANELFSIVTMGFRGEALASIAAVSRTKIASSNSSDGLGYEVANDGGVQTALKPCPHNRGTTVSVRDLFFNVPARKKFMKTRRGEHLAIVRMLEQLVIPFSSIHFTVTMDGKRVFDLPSSNNPTERIASVAGAQFAKKLIMCQGSASGLDALVYVSTPEGLRQRPRFQSLYVNLRRIDNDSVSYAVKEAFSKFLGFNYRPSFFCFLDIDPSRVDVNVHPTKQQIKFDNERELFGFVYSIVKKGISGHMEKSTNPVAQNRDQTGDELHKTAFSDDKQLETSFEMPDNFEKTEDRVSQTILTFPSMPKTEEKEVDLSKDSSIQLSSVEQNWDLISCYQIHGVFILAPIKNGVIIIDQHAAHERVLFEQALEDIKRGRSASQQLLFPIVVELSPTEKAVIESGQPYFSAFGFDVDDFGGLAVSISAIPAFLRDSAVENTIRGMIKYLLEGRNPEEFIEPERRFAAAFACGAAIKAGQNLSQEEMNALLNSLFSTKNPYTCPHGRPTLVRISLNELSRRFLR